MTPFAMAVNSALLHFVWQGVVVAFLLWIVLAALRRSPSNSRYVASCVALGLLTLAPVVTMALAYDRSIPPVKFIHGVTIFPIAVFAGPIAAPPDWLALARLWLLPAWACGVAVLSIRLLWGYSRVSSLKRKGTPAEPAVLAVVANLSRRIGVARPVRVLISSLADGPSVIGCLKPLVLLPAATLLGLTPQQLEAVLAHELAHIRRHDYLVNIVQMLLETLLFYHPAVWWISSRIRQERELCCDDIAVRSCGDAVVYARALTALERMRVISPSLAFGAQDGPLMFRIQRLLGAVPRERGPSRLPGLVAILLAATCFSTNMNPVKAEAPLLQPPAPPSTPAFSSVPARPQIHALTQLAQATQPAHAASQATSSSGDSGSVTVEVSIDKNGQVSDARVVTGPENQRRAALLRALGMRFPLEEAATHRWVDILAPPAPLPASDPRQSMLRAVPTRAGAEQTIRTLQAKIATLQAQQAQASATDRAAFQQQIDESTRSLQQMEPIAAGQDPLVGTTLENIEISYLTDGERDQLIAQLPIHAHDVLTDDSMRAAVRVAHAAEPNATIYFGQTEGGQAGLVIIAPPPHLERSQLQYWPAPVVRPRGLDAIR
jgi:beta-lactamase regulating signal transducer with metallopeptidase domain